MRHSLDIARLDFTKGAGLMPAVVQHVDTGQVLMVGYMNRIALELTLERTHAVFFSRSKNRLWEKGETSGNRLVVTEIRADCDGDTLLVLARPEGPTCHVGAASCFGEDACETKPGPGILRDLEGIIAQRILLRPAGSYTARLVESGIRRIAQKVGEEGLELALAAAGGTDENVIDESADLLYHVLVLLGARGLTLSTVLAELRSRHARGQ
ncbi:MAG: bifunctional phosphoribosyl-AMP cyclohydrolase/phosphoribosyl-ATP diphosphatase HisIE [Proteobacteria bacterium]|nr:bifunctional phosphoribosyl-AMP cyclohydrolase/phosphoribosyl-ATP diphosphatase HisIE [Pseudomonadota bacterium]